MILASPYLLSNLIFARLSDPFKHSSRPNRNDRYGASDNWRDPFPCQGLPPSQPKFNNTLDGHFADILDR
jgi:hypothetical protein